MSQSDSTDLNITTHIGRVGSLLTQMEKKKDEKPDEWTVIYSTWRKKNT